MEKPDPIRYDTSCSSINLSILLLEQEEERAHIARAGERNKRRNVKKAPNSALMADVRYETFAAKNGGTTLIYC